jgi:hypothetical protein
MTQEQTKKIEELREKIGSLNVEINKCEAEINTIMIDGSADFEGSYVLHSDGVSYDFMKVERQVNRDAGRSICLYGPAISLADNPLSPAFEADDELDMGQYDEDGVIEFNPRILQKTSFEKITKIKEKDMAVVVNCYCKTMLKRFFNDTYTKDL